MDFQNVSKLSGMSTLYISREKLIEAHRFLVSMRNKGKMETAGIVYYNSLSNEEARKSYIKFIDDQPSENKNLKDGNNALKHVNHMLCNLELLINKF